jgi:hypothetical protein
MGVRLGQIAEANPYAPVITVYDEMRQLCLSKLPVDACDGLIPARPLYYPPEYTPTIPWWVLLAGGIVIGKML